MAQTYAVKGVGEMKYKGEASLRDGQTLILRSLNAQDAAKALGVCRRTAGETMNMMRYADEWTITAEQEREAIVKAENDPHSLMLGAFVEGNLVGISSLRPVHPADRARHRAGFGISILRAYWGRGIGTAMMRATIGMAESSSLEQLELEVLSTNESAIRLYHRMGFAEYGRLPRMMKYRDGTYADGVLMMLDLRAKR